MDAAAAHLLQILEGTLSPDAMLRQQAEAALEAGSKQAGFATALMNVVLANDVALGIRQLAAVVLKKAIREHWTFEAPGYREPPITEGEKAHVREMLPTGLADANSKLRTAVAMAVASIAKWDCPQAWPALMPSLLGAIVKRKDINLVSGSVRCLAMFLDELSEEQVLEITPTLLPELLQIVRDDEYGAPLQRKAFSILHVIVGALHTLAGSCLQQVKAVVSGMLVDWFTEFVRILSRRSSPGGGSAGADAWAVQYECLRVMTVLVSSFSKLCAPHIRPAMAATWELFAGSLPLYQKVVVEGEDAEIDEDGGQGEEGEEAVDLEALVAQLLEFVLTLVGNQRYQGLVKASLADLLYLCLGYMQMTADQVDRWGSNPNEYVADEEDDFSTVRASGEMLLDELLEAFESEVLPPLASAAQRRLQEAAAARSTGHVGWWRLREAVLLAVGTISDRLVEMAQAGRQLPLDLPALMDSVLQEDLSGQGVSPFLAGRALWVTARLAPAISPARRPAFLHAAVLGLAAGLPPAVQIGACRALAQLCRGAAPAELQAHSQAMYSGLCGMLQRTHEDVLHLVLETLAQVVRADPAGAVACEQYIAEPTLHIWINNVIDPLLSEDARELLAALAGVPACLPSLQARMLPTLCGIIANPQPHSSILVDGAVELITLVLAPSSPEVAAQIHAAATPHMLHLLVQTDDSEILRSATSYLRTLLQVGGASVLEWGGVSPTETLHALLQPVQRLLQPEVEDHACDQVGSLVLELLRHAGQHMAPLLPGLLAALARKLAAAEDSATVQSLITVVAQLVRLDVQQLVSCLAGIQLHDGRSALAVVMDKWVERQIEIRTAYDIKLTTTALAALLTCGHPALDALQVRGQRMDTGSGIRTRARAQQQAEQWTTVPLRVKLLLLLTDAYIEATTQDEEEAEESDGGWEEVGSSGDEAAEGGSLSGAVAKRLFGLEDALALAAEDVDDTLLSNIDAKEAERRKSDPISQIDLPAVLRDLFRTLATQQPALLQATGEQLTPTQLQAVQAVFQ